MLEVVEVFVAQLPDFVLAVNVPVPLAEIEVVYHHPSTEALVDRATVDHMRRVPTTSNSQSARLVHESPVPAATVTNSLCADGYQLETVAILAHGTPMSFNIFQARPTGAQYAGTTTQDRDHRESVAQPR
jgi:prephenate dehydratase